MDVQHVIKEQDQHIDEISGIVKRLKDNSKLINNELDNQNMYLHYHNFYINFI